MGEVVATVALVAIVMVIVANILSLLLRIPAMGTHVWPAMRQQWWWPVPAERKAETLLKNSLTAREYDRLLTSGRLEIPSPTRPHRVYQIPRGPGQVVVVEHGRAIERLCVQPASIVLPDADVILMHKLLIESDEESYLRTANHFPRILWRY
jgi:hypothetical protein